MALSRQLLQTAMNRLLSKLNTLLQPRVEQEDFCLEPLPSEIQTSADLLRWFADELPVARQILQSEIPAQRRNWPNVHDWRNFVKSIEGLQCPVISSDTPAEEGEVHTSDTPSMRSAVKAFADARRQLLDECKLMLSDAPGATAPSKASQSTFLPNESQRRVYRELVQTYYREYIVGKDLKHKELMLHWAAVYQAIADRSGLRNQPFCGPEFDAFIYDYCGIAYNVSASRRGRYRSVQDLLARCLSNQTECPQRQDFDLFRRNMVHIIAGQQRVVTNREVYRDVPRELPARPSQPSENPQKLPFFSPKK